MIHEDLARLLSQDTMMKDWVGEVVDNEDPETQFRCKIKVYGLFDELETESMPWAFPANHGVFAGGEGGFGSGSVPKIGSLMKVKFANGDIYSPEYYSIQNINSALQSEISGDYQGTHVLAYDEDADLKILYQPGTGVKIHLKGSHVTVNPDESITIEHSGSSSLIELIGSDVNIVTNRDVNVTAQNDVAVTASKNVTVDCVNVLVNHSSTIELGKGAAEKLVLGNSFMALFNAHTHTFIGIPTTPPVTPMTVQMLSGRGGIPVVKTL